MALALAAITSGRVEAAGHPEPGATPGARDVRQFGADPTGERDSSAAFLAAAAAGPFTVGEGAYRLSGRLAIDVHFAASAGARINGPAAIAFNGGFEAPIAPVFGPGLAVSFAPAFAPEGRPEWWGARANTPEFDCEPALRACVGACPVTRLQPADYWIARTLKLMTSWRAVVGVGMNGAGAESGDPDHHSRPNDRHRSVGLRHAAGEHWRLRPRRAAAGADRGEVGPARAARGRRPSRWRVRRASAVRSAELRRPDSGRARASTPFSCAAVSRPI